MADVTWIKHIIGMFDGNSFKRIKKAKIGGESYRDKLTAVWVEILDLAGKCNADGQFIETPEMIVLNIDDIAVLIDREPEELKLCMDFYINNRMVTFANDIYEITNWEKYQNNDKLAEMREQTRQRVAKHREKKRLQVSNVTCNGDVTLRNDKDKDIDIDIELAVAVATGDNADDEQNTFELMGGKLGKNVIILTPAQEESLLDKLGLDGFNHYVDKLSSFIIEKNAKVSNHYATILKWAKEDTKV